MAYGLEMKAALSLSEDRKPVERFVERLNTLGIDHSILNEVSPGRSARRMGQWGASRHPDCARRGGIVGAQQGAHVKGACVACAGEWDDGVMLRDEHTRVYFHMYVRE